MIDLAVLEALVEAGCSAAQLLAAVKVMAAGCDRISRRYDDDPEGWRPVSSSYGSVCDAARALRDKFRLQAEAEELAGVGRS
jgi:hypothetical protein